MLGGREEIEQDVVRYPEEFARRYRATGLWRDGGVADIVRDAARDRPDGAAVRAEDGTLSYGELDRESDRVGAALLELGLRPGDRALFQLGNTTETVLAYYGAVKAGVIPVCAIPQHGERDMLALAELSGARAYLVQADFRGYDLPALARRVAARASRLDHVVVCRSSSAAERGLEALAAAQAAGDARRAVDGVQTSPDDVAVFQLSGGTTGTPKIIPRFHAEYVYNARQWAETCGWNESTVVLHPIPLIHNAGIAAAMQPCHIARGTFVLRSRPDPELLLETIERERVQVLPVVPPAVLVRLLESDRRRDHDLSSLTHLIVGGQVLPRQWADAVEQELGIRCVQMFGMAEGMFLRTADDAPEWVRKQTVGSPISPADEVRILDPGSERELAPGEIGELCCRGPYTIRGYFAAPRHNATAFTSDGFYRTGDLAKAHPADGGLVYSVEGRIKDMINRGAEKIHAGEVEEVVAAHPDVDIAAAVAMPDRELGERVCVYVKLVEGADPLGLADLTAFLRGRGLAVFKLPERLEVVEDLPLANIGKVDKRALRADVAARLEREAQRG